MVFTTWKCLGDGSSQSFYWKSHLTSAAPKHNYGLGHSYWTFESGDSHPSTYEIDADELQWCVASLRGGPGEVPPPGYAAVVTESPVTGITDMEEKDLMGV